jgi:CubicO group peptidase (beta-lactamase class C family)
MRYFLPVILCPWPALAAPDFDDISEDLAKFLEDHGKVPSIAAAAVLDGELVAAGAAGVRRIDGPGKVTLDDRYHIGSCTKSMTATLAAIMVREGTVAWDTRVGEILGEAEVHKDFRDATLEQLLSNSAGCPKDIPRDLMRSFFSSGKAPDEQRLALAAEILSAPPVYEPGTGYEYSNAGFSIAGAMLEKLGGRPYEDLLSAKLFEPLGMKSAGFGAPGERGKVSHPFGHRPLPVKPGPLGDNPPAISPAGRVHCTVGDWAKYASLHLGHGPDGLLSDEEREFLRKPRTETPPYGLGWIAAERTWAGGTCYTHAGSNTMWHAVVWLAPERDFAALAATNIGTKEGFAAIDAAVALLVRRVLANN